MFDIGFSEIVVIAVVALIVIGPEKLPKTARTLGLLFGRLQRYVNEVKADINREIELDELRKIQHEMKSAARDIETSVTQAAQGFESSVRAVESELNQAAAAPGAGAPAAAEAPLPIEPPPAIELPLPSASLPTGTQTDDPAARGVADPAAAVAPAARGTGEPDAPRQATLPGFGPG